MLRPGTGRGGRALRNGVPQTGSGPDGSSPQRTTPCAAGNLTVAPGTRPASSGRPLPTSPARTSCLSPFSNHRKWPHRSRGSWRVRCYREALFCARRCERSEDGDALPGLRKKRWPVRLPGGRGTRPGERRRRHGWASQWPGHVRPIARLGRHPPAVRAGLCRCVTECGPAGHTIAVGAQWPCGARILQTSTLAIRERWPLPVTVPHRSGKQLPPTMHRRTLPASAANAQPTPASAGSPSTSSAPAPPLRIAPFVTAPATEERAQDRPSASSGSAARPGTANTAWSGGEFEWHPAEVPGRSQ